VSSVLIRVIPAQAGIHVFSFLLIFLFAFFVFFRGKFFFFLVIPAKAGIHFFLFLFLLLLTTDS